VVQLRRLLEKLRDEEAPLAARARVSREIDLLQKQVEEFKDRCWKKREE
jgi:hypothetical protein